MIIFFLLSFFFQNFDNRFCIFITRLESPFIFFIYEFYTRFNFAIMLYLSNVETRVVGFFHSRLRHRPTISKYLFNSFSKDVAQRVDLRNIDVCSVDPPGCTDIDDALHCRELPNGNLEVGVHIADVSHFIRPGTALDREAALRGTTVYLVDKRIDMVPGESES